MCFENPNPAQIRRSRRRPRTCLQAATTVLGLASACVVVQPYSASALSSLSTGAATRTASLMSSSISSRPILETEERLFYQRNNQLLDHSNDYDFSFEDDEGDDDDEDYPLELDGFQALQKSTGSEILEAELQSQVDVSRSNPNKFLDAHVRDASYLEKVAMSSIPEQLPRAAVKAIQTNVSSQKKSKKASSSVQDTKIRVSPKQEVELGKLIQRGVKLHKIKADFEQANGRQITRNEWVQETGLSSAKELRKQVSDYRRAKQLLVEANMGLVHTVVKSMFAKFQVSGVSFEECVQEGSLGLLRAAELFDPSAGIRFSTYATIWIKGVLSNTHVKEHVKLPQREKTTMNKIRDARKELTRANGSEPTTEAVADYLGMKVADVASTQHKMSQVHKLFSLEYELAGQSRSGDDGNGYNAMESHKNFQEDASLAEYTQMRADVVAVMARNLEPREARLMRLRYGLTDGRQRSLQECADSMGISKALAVRLNKRCLTKLREAADANSLEEYLLTIA